MTHTTRIHPLGQPAVLVFPGQGSQWPGMAAELLDTSAAFTARLRECAAAVELFVEWSVEDVLRQRPGAPSLDRVEVVQPVLFCVHVALADLWLAHGVVPQAVVGQSQGEIAAACVAGALTVEDAALIIVARSQLFADELAGRGGIASLAFPATQIDELLAPYRARLEVAGIIGPHTVTVAGELDALEDLVAQLNRRNIRAKVIPASIPSHSVFVEPLCDRLGHLLEGIRPRASRIPFYSTVAAGPVDGGRLTADYWYANARRPVLFDAAMRRLLTDGCTTFIECSAHPVLTTAITDTAHEMDCRATVTGTLRRGAGGIDRFQQSLAALTTTVAVASPHAATAA